MVAIVTLSQLVGSASLAQKKVRRRNRCAFQPSVVAKYKARLAELQEQARQKVPLADENTLNIRFDS